MQVEIFRLASQPIRIEVKDGASVRDVLDAPGSGKAVGRDDITLAEAAAEMYGSVDRLGSFRVDGAPAELDTPVPAGATLLIIPKVEGGRG